MVDCHETHNMYPDLSATSLNIPLNYQKHFRLNKINEIKKLLKIIKKKKKKRNKIVILARRKLNSIESKVSEELRNNEISHEDFMTVINEEKKYREIKESIRFMNNQRSDTEKN